MNYTRKEQNAITFSSFLMICYAVALLIWLRLNSWEITGLLLFSIIVVNIILSFFRELNKLITALVCIFVSIVTIFVFDGIMLWFGIILGIYGICLTVYLLIEK